jgi:hypothetical protein
MRTLHASCCHYHLLDYTMAEITTHQRMRYTLWENDSTKKERSRLIPGCPFDDGTTAFYADDPDSMHGVMAIAVQALEKPKPTMEDFRVCFTALDEFYDLDNDLLKEGC